MAEPTGGVIAVAVGLELLKRIPESGIAQLSTKLVGKKIVLIGQIKSGKTTFAEYFCDGVLEDEHYRPRSYDIEKIAAITIKLGRDQSLVMKTKNIKVIPGHLHPKTHAEVAYKERPDCIVILLDVTTKAEGKPETSFITWIKEYAQEYEAQLVKKGQRRRKFPESAFVVLNKYDKINESDYREKKERCEKVLRDMKLSKYNRLEKARVLPCISVTNSEGSKYIDKVIIAIAKSLKYIHKD